jgi:hypothetical protein
MSNPFIRVLMMVATLLAGCAHRGAVRVECGGPLSAINPPVHPTEGPLSLVPTSPGAAADEGKQAP